MRIAMMFPGQGSQAQAMGKDFYEQSDIAKDMVNAASQRLGFDMKELLFEQNDRLDQTEFAQPAILLVSMIAFKLLQEQIEVVPRFFLGHSLGEISALCASGAIDYLDALELVHYRGQLMKQACEGKDATMMVIVGLDAPKVEEVVSAAQNEGKALYAANYNQDAQIVVAGKKADLSAMESRFKEAGAKRALLLNMSVASHCPMLQDAVSPLAEKLRELVSNNFSAPILSNVTTEPYDTKDEAIALLSDQLVKPVRYMQMIHKIAPEVDIALEFGHGGVLKGLNRRIEKSLNTLCISDMASLEAAVEALR